MQSTIQTYDISKIKKLIDINNDMVNFKTSFRARRIGDAPFSILVVDQNTLDSTDPQELQYKEVDDELTGEILADKNVYQNYFIILKSKVPTKVEIELQTEQLPDNISAKSNKETTTVSKPIKKQHQAFTFKMDYLLYLIILGVILFFLTQLFSSSKKTTGIMNQSLLEKLKHLSQTYKQ